VRTHVEQLAGRVGTATAAEFLTMLGSRLQSEDLEKQLTFSIGVTGNERIATGILECLASQRISSQSAEAVDQLSELLCYIGVGGLPTKADVHLFVSGLFLALSSERYVEQWPTVEIIALQLFVQAARKLAPEERLLSMRFLAGLGLQASRRTLPGVPERLKVDN
jgi:hypothetical protein